MVLDMGIKKPGYRLGAKKIPLSVQGDFKKDRQRHTLPQKLQYHLRGWA